MRLLVSVANVDDAAAAMAGGADVIDAKDPHAGALGAVSLPVFREIHARVAGARPISAALGDADDERGIERDARAFADAGAAFVKVGFSTRAHADDITSLVAAAVRGASAGSDGRCGVVAVTYADRDELTGTMATLPGLAARAGAAGVLLDTANKRGTGLCGLIPPGTLTTWVGQAHATGLFVALAGSLTTADLSIVQAAGADIAGVRGAACEGGRTGRVTAERVRRCCAACAIFDAFQEAT